MEAPKVIFAGPFGLTVKQNLDMPSNMFAFVHSNGRADIYAMTESGLKHKAIRVSE